MRAFVKKLRRKLGDDAVRPSYILTERTVGYCMPLPDDPGGRPRPSRDSEGISSTSVDLNYLLIRAFFDA